MDHRKFVLTFCVLTLLFVLCQSLDIGDDGTCETKTPKWNTTLLFKNITGKKKCSKGYRICTKEDLQDKRFDTKKQICCAKTSLAYDIEILCCDGWMYDSTKDICQAQCKNGCENGTCVAPNTCQCVPPLVLESDNKCAEPKCDSPCLNGKCTAPNICTCDEGFETVDNVTCVPVCTQPCTHGFCSAPNTCSCDSGYVRDYTSSSCYKPCDGACYNGTCVYGVCVCNEGFHLYNETCSLNITECTTCDGNCTSVDGKPCLYDSVQSEVARTGLAGLELTWTLGGAIGILLLTLLMVVIHRTYRKGREYETKTADECNPYGSVIYTVPDTLIQRNLHDEQLEEEEVNGSDDEGKEKTNERLLTPVINSNNVV